MLKLRRKSHWNALLGCLKCSISRSPSRKAGESLGSTKPAYRMQELTWSVPKQLVIRGDKANGFEGRWCIGYSLGESMSKENATQREFDVKLPKFDIPGSHTLHSHIGQ